MENFPQAADNPPIKQGEPRRHAGDECRRADRGLCAFSRASDELVRLRRAAGQVSQLTERLSVLMGRAARRGVLVLDRGNRILRGQPRRGAALFGEAACGGWLGALAARLAATGHPANGSSRRPDWRAESRKPYRPGFDRRRRIVLLHDITDTPPHAARHRAQRAPRGDGRDGRGLAHQLRTACPRRAALCRQPGSMELDLASGPWWPPNAHGNACATSSG